MENKYSQTYMMLLDLLFKTNTIKGSIYSTSIDGNKYSRNKTNETTQRIPQELTITDITILEDCTPLQHHIICMIQYQLKEYNALWECPNKFKKSSTGKIALKGLIDRKILIKTETTNIYIVNPLYIRRGDFHSVLITTATMLSNISKVTSLQIADKKPVKQFTAPDTMITPKAIGYGDINNN